MYVEGDINLDDFSWTDTLSFLPGGSTESFDLQSLTFQASPGQYLQIFAQSLGLQRSKQRIHTYIRICLKSNKITAQIPSL